MSTTALALTTSRTPVASTTRAPLPAGFTDATVDVNGVRIHYVVGGAGEPLVLLHGWPQTWYAWRRLLPALAERYTVVAPDTRGAGGSSRPAPDVTVGAGSAGAYDANTLAEDVRQLVRHLGLGPIRLAGHDLGVGVAYAYAAAHPESVSRLTLLDGPLLGVGPAPAPRPGLWHPAFHATPHLPELLTAGREREYLQFFFTHFAHRKAAVTAAEVDEFARAYAAPGAMSAGFELYRALPTNAAQNAAHAQTRLSMPVLALGGQYSAGPGMLAAARAVADDVRGGVVPDAGHWLAEENPESLLAELLAFLA